MKINFILRISLLSLLILLSCSAFSQNRNASNFKKVFYENDSTMFADNTINFLNTTSDSSYFLGGTQINKTDNEGNITWNNGLFNNFSGQDAIPYFSPDGRYFILQGNFKFINVDANETILWQKYLVDTSCYCIHPKHITQTTDGGFIITGYKSVYDTSFYRNRIFIVKTNSFGDTLWTRTIAKSSYDNDGYYAQQTSDGGYLVLANVEYVNSGQDFKIGILKLNNLGQEEWYKTSPRSIYYLAPVTGLETADSACAIISSSDSITDGTYFLKIKENGDFLFDTIYLGKKFNGGFTEMANGNYLVGMHDSLSTIDKDSRSITMSRAYIGVIGENIPITVITHDYKDGFIMAGNSSHFDYDNALCGSHYNYFHFYSYLINTDSSLQDVSLPSGVDDFVLNKGNDVILYPNPSVSGSVLFIRSDVQHYSVRITDIIGNEIKSLTHVSEKQLLIERGEMNAGVYFVQITINGKLITKKMVVQ